MWRTQNMSGTLEACCSGFVLRFPFLWAVPVDSGVGSWLSILMISNREWRCNQFSSPLFAFPFRFDGCQFLGVFFPLVIGSAVVQLMDTVCIFFLSFPFLLLFFTSRSTIANVPCGVVWSLCVYVLIAWGGQLHFLMSVSNDFILKPMDGMVRTTELGLGGRYFFIFDYFNFCWVCCREGLGSTYPWLRFCVPGNSLFPYSVFLVGTSCRHLSVEKLIAIN